MTDDDAPSFDVLGDLHAHITAAVQEIARAGDAVGTPRVELTRPSEEKFGDFASNVALMLAPVVRRNPRQVADEIAARVRDVDGVSSVDVAGPGFVNVTLDDGWFTNTLAAVLAAGDRYATGVADRPLKVLLEFVSANPTGPIHVASARHAAYGDSLARVMRHAGHDVATEYYVNDAGRQITLFGESILARGIGLTTSPDDPAAAQPGHGVVPEGGYEGDYVTELADEIEAKDGDDPVVLGRQGVALMIERAQEVLERFRVHHDRFQSEVEIHDSGLVDEALAELDRLGQTFDEDGATMLRTTAFGDDKDRALLRTPIDGHPGTPTYFAADAGYLLHKYRRGFERLITVLGADHYGYIARLKAAAQALGNDAESCEVVILNMVNLVEAGEQKKMSKRRGDFVSLGELIDRVGVDAARWFLLNRSHEQTLDLDIDVATEQSSANPVFYVQYAHARICSIARKAETDLGVEVDSLDDDQLIGRASLESHPLDAAERRLVKRLAEFPQVVRDASERRHPHAIGFFAHALASDFTTFYRDCRVVGDDVDLAVTHRRLGLSTATRAVLATSLDLLGVSAPTSM